MQDMLDLITEFTVEEHIAGLEETIGQGISYKV